MSQLAEGRRISADAGRSDMRGDSRHQSQTEPGRQDSTTISNSRRLRNQIEWMLPELTATTAAIVQHPRFRELYPEWMVVVHQMIRASVPLMRTALLRCRELEAADALAAAMAPYFEQHIKEEMHHDDWLLDDLELLGIPRSDVLRRIPSRAVASFIGAHYYWIHHHHPVAELGQITVQEGYPAPVELIDGMVERTGYPRAAFRTLEKHCHLDTDHRDDLNAALDGMPLTEEHFVILEVSALHTVRASARAYRAVLPPADRGDAAAADAPLRATVMPRRHPELTAARNGDPGSFYVDAAHRDAAFQIGEQEQFLLAQCDGRQTPDEVCDAFRGRFSESLTRRELDDFLQIARSEHLLAGNGVSR